MLFLSLSIGRNRLVTRRPSFHYPARARPAPIPRSGFTVELADACRRTLLAWPLVSGLQPEYSWPKSLTAQLPYPADVKWMLVWEGDRLIYEECIPDAPRIDLTCTATREGVRLDWASDPSDDLWFLVQWQDTDGTWRGLAPKARETGALAPRALFRREASVRVLATSGISTSAAAGTVVLPGREPTFTVAITELRRPGLGPARPALAGLHAFAFDEAGRGLSRPGFRWFDERGRQIHVGATLPIAAASSTREVTVVLAGHRGRGQVSHTWRRPGDDPQAP
jgi:hypothetical protein